MEIYFGKPEQDHSIGMILGAHKGSILSSAYSLTTEENDFLRKNSEKLHTQLKKDVVCQSFMYKAPAKKEVQSIQIIDLETIDSISSLKAQEIGAKIFTLAESLQEEIIVVDFSHNFPPESVAHIAAGFKIRSFKFDKYKTQADPTIKIEHVYFISSNPAASQQTFKELDIMVEAVETVRNLSSEVPNKLYPEAFAHQAKELKKHGIKVEILDEKDMDKLGMNALLGVAQGSVHPPFLVTMCWNGADKSEPPIALVGKGVTFDSGGISLKPSNNMHEMKEDMTGAAIVLSTLQMAAQLKLPLNLVGVAGMVENMPSGAAQRPSDVVQSMSGLTIEVQNTDAEGRLVLADAVHYTQEHFHPKCLIDFATLTGAIQIALGQEFAGLFSNNDKLSNSLIAAGQEVHERLWRLPMDDAFDKDIDSDIADVKNVGSGRGAGSITAAHFIQRFVHDIPWAHIDIAAVTYDKKERPLTGSGFTGFGVRLMYAFLKKMTLKTP